ncbi:CopL family metal-binding regulatory protein [Stenotrophomonas aracearum]|jgi:hypothetical protein|uniref:CopL family metal-binding regulatory protein n=1 Tax=Stenotrophomonas aracearum TaxID=3003272 RepID=A0ABY9YBT5_9GAMM|nr:CopL family metal-binding regulatory protein [Stenotrophomonas sp. A5588]WNH47885.1 CopL family metal-binding regulatory protein [Stenotrophomonas sp. A5588]
MSAGGLLLRVVLMLSLLLNGLNAAMAGPMVLEMAQAPAVQQAAAPPCHGESHAALPTAPTGTDDAQAREDSEHCKIKDCLRNCAQQPSLTAQIAWLPIPPPLFQAPLPVAQSSLPSLPLDRITRPPIA